MSLEHALRMKFGTSPDEPTEQQLQAILREIEEVRSRRIPTQTDWHQAVYKYCPTAGRWKYEGLDTSDLNALLAEMKRPR